MTRSKAYRREYAKERREHPELPHKVIRRIVLDHLRGPPKVRFRRRKGSMIFGPRGKYKHEHFRLKQSKVMRRFKE